MKKKTLFGTAITVIMIVLVSIAPSINANADTLSVETPQEENATPIVLVLQLMTKLRNHKEIQELEENIECVENVENEVLQIIEEDDKLNSIVEQLSVEDCGCEDDSSALEWRYPVICIFLYPLWIIAVGMVFLFSIWQFKEFFDAIGNNLDCFWS